MFILQNGKLYIHKSKYKLVGVNITPTGVEKVKKSDTDLGEEYSVLTAFEAYAKFNITNENPYLFNGVEETKEVGDDGGNSK